MTTQSLQKPEMKKLSPIDAVRADLTRMKEQLKAALPPHIHVDKYIRVAVTSLQMSPILLECDKQSLYGAWMKSAQIGLLPDGKEAAIVPYNGKANFQPMIGGLMKLVRNSREISTWSIRVVKENDYFDYQLGDDEKIIHKPALKERGQTVGAYSIVTLKSGEKSREFMDIDELNSIRTRSRAKDAGPWKTDTDEMYKKTVGKRHYKVLPSSTDLENDKLAEAMEGDEDTIEVHHVDHIPDEPKRTRLEKIIDQKQISAPKDDEQLEREAIQAESKEVTL